MPRDRWLVRPVLALVLGVVYLAGPTWAGTFPASSRKEAIQIRNRVMAAQFLTRATFGARPDEVEKLAEQIGQVGRRRAFSDWIERQFTVPPTKMRELAKKMIVEDNFTLLQQGIGQNRYRDYAWWHNAIAADDQLRQRVAWALAQTFVINRNPAVFNSRRNDISGEPQYLGICDYYDMLLDNSFGTYRETIEDVSLHPVMGVFLSHVRNRKFDPSTGRFPDENFGRGILQLMSIGLHEMRINGQLKKDRDGNLIDTYDNEDIRTWARVFTGLSYNDPGRNFFNSRTNLNEPMVMFDDQHDVDEKVLFRGTVLPAGQTGLQDLGGALDNLASHPNTGPFLARRLIQRLTNSNPSKGYIRRVANTFQRSRGDWRRVIRAILLDREALNSQRYQIVRRRIDGRRRVVGLRVLTRGTEYARLAEPVVRYVSFIRAFNGSSDYHTGRFMIPSQDNDMKQSPYGAPSVFNFYLPDHQPQAFKDYVTSRRIPNRELVGPEYQIFTSVIANRFANQLRSDTRDAKLDFTLINNSTAGRIEIDINLDFSSLEAMADDPSALVSQLDLLLCHGSMQDASKDIIAKVITDATTDPTSRARGAVLSVLTSPDCAIQE